MTRQIRHGGVDQLRTDGFLVLKTSAEAGRAMVEIFNAAYAFFRTPLEEKARCSLPNDNGYRPMGIEYSQSPERPDPAESFTASAGIREAIPDLPSLEGRALYAQILAMIDILEPIAETLTIQMAEAFGGQYSSELLGGAFTHWSCLQLNYSRPSELTVPFIHESHEDGHLITIACSTGPGLEIQTASGSFLPITIEHDEVLIMPGEIAWLLSGGQIRPLYHRVRRQRGQLERVALLFFADMDPRLCKPWVTNDVNRNIDIGARMLINPTRFGLGEVTLE